MFFRRANHKILNHVKFSILLFSNLIPCFLSAQNEAAVWSLGYGKQLNFQSGNAVVDTFAQNTDVNSTICGKDGNLLLFTNGKTVWNSKNEPLVNGTDLFENERALVPGTRPLFVPLPGGEGRYFLIYETVPGGGYHINEKKLVYAEIDINAASGRGEVLEKNKLLHQDYHHTFSVSGYCNNSYYWLLVDANDNMDMSVKYDRIYFYKIDKNGIHPTPQINEPLNGQLNMGNSAGYKFSPNGDKFVFHYQENATSSFFNVIADFNFLNGEIYNLRYLRDGDINFRSEFSPNGRFLYSFLDTCLIQMNVGYSDGGRIQSSQDTIFIFDSYADSIQPGYGLQLAPDGKIYFYSLLSD